MDEYIALLIAALVSCVLVLVLTRAHEAFHGYRPTRNLKAPKRPPSGGTNVQPPKPLTTPKQLGKGGA